MPGFIILAALSPTPFPLFFLLEGRMDGVSPLLPGCEPPLTNPSPIVEDDSYASPFFFFLG